MQLLEDEPPLVDDPAYADVSKQLSRAVRRGDNDAAKAVQDKIQQLVEKRHKDHVERVKQEHGGELRKEVADLFASRPQDPSTDEDLELDKPEELLDKAYEKYQKELEDWNTRIGAYMGQLPLENGKPKAEVLQLSTVSGHCTRVGLLLTFEFISFERVDRGAPALVNWLSKQGCSGFKYSIDAGLIGGGFDEAGLE